MVIEIQIDEAQTRLKELVNNLGPDDEVRLLDHARVIGRITSGGAKSTFDPQSGDEFRQWLEEFSSRHRGVGGRVDDTRESIYD
ncbi:hypothetical protein [Lacunimicrobium album]